MKMTVNIPRDDRVVVLKLGELRPSALYEIIESLAALDENHPRLPMLKDKWDELTRDNN